MLLQLRPAGQPLVPSLHSLAAFGRNLEDDYTGVYELRIPLALLNIKISVRQKVDLIQQHDG